jgi:hypothetical protein
MTIDDDPNATLVHFQPFSERNRASVADVFEKRLTYQQGQGLYVQANSNIGAYTDIVQEGVSGASMLETPELEIISSPLSAALGSPRGGGVPEYQFERLYDYRLSWFDVNGGSGI